MIEVIVWVMRAVDAAADVVPDADLVVPVEPPGARPVPPRGAAGAVVSGGTGVAGAHATVVGVDGGPGAATVVEGASDVGGVGVVEVVDVEVVAGAGDDPGVESTGVVGGVVAAGAGGVSVGAAGVLGVVQSSSAALAAAGTDEAVAVVEPVDRGAALVVLEGTALELV